MMEYVITTRKKHEHYNEGEKLHLLRSYYQFGMNEASFCEQYGISGITLLNKWLAKYESVVKEVSLAPCRAPTDMSDRSKGDHHGENVRLKKRVKGSEKALVFFRLRTETCDLMITRVEEYFNIPIRKKPGIK